MARREDDPEDLLAAATALTQRASFRINGYEGLVVIGFRQDGSASFYFGAEPVYQFNSKGALRRAFVDGLIYKAIGGQLASLRRERTAHSLELVRYELNQDEIRAFLDAAARQLARAETALIENRFELEGEVPLGAGMVARTLHWLAVHGRDLKIARSPRVGNVERQHDDLGPAIGPS